MQIVRSGLIVAALTLLVLEAPLSHAQSLTGVPGLVTIPTAEMAEDGTFTAGYHFLNHPYRTFYPDDPFGGMAKYHAHAPYASLVFLPFLELNLRLTRSATNDLREDYLGDRFVGVRVQALRETSMWPAVVVGAHDFVGRSRRFAATYVAVSKTMHPPVVDHVSLHLGYGPRLLGSESNESDSFTKRYQFDGLFGGVAVAPVPGLRLMVEYDSHQLSGGVDAVLWKGLRILVGIVGFEALSGGVGYTLTLPH